MRREHKSWKTYIKDQEIVEVTELEWKDKKDREKTQKDKYTKQTGNTVEEIQLPTQEYWYAH